MKSRRQFIRSSAFAGVSLIGLRAFSKESMPANSVKKLTVLHTNDTHSRIDPFPDNHRKYGGMGGAEHRAVLIDSIRANEDNVLLLDAGDVFQGTPYFNMFNGSLEMKLMSMMRYDASTIGNHEFDIGMDGFMRAQKEANFPFINSNYDFSDTPMHDATIPYKVFKKKGIKVGVFGLGVELEGLVDKKLYGDTLYKDPISEGKKQAQKLKQDLDCDLIICLSHLGYEYQSKKVCDRYLAEAVPEIDLIIGGHTHTFLNEPIAFQDKVHGQTLVNQVGWAGINIGRVDFFFGEKNESLGIESEVRSIVKGRV
jgi:5'-nucleotidase